MKQRAAIFQGLFYLLCLAAVPRADEAIYERVEILVLGAHHFGCQQTAHRLEGLWETLGDTVELYVEHMDAQRFPPNDRTCPQLANRLKSKYAAMDFSAIVLLGDEALDFAIDYNDELFPQPPKVFVGVNQDAATLPRGLPPGFTGFSQRTDFLGTLEVALALRPTAKNVVLLGDGTLPGRIAREQFERELAAFPNVNLQSIDGNAMTFAEIVEILQTLPADSLAFFLGFWRDRTGKTFPPEISLTTFAETTSAPIFVFSDHHLGSGAVGGLVASPLAQGRTAGELLSRILSGETVDHLPVGRDVQTLPYFDYQALQRFGMPLETLPANTRFANSPPPFFGGRDALELVAIVLVVGLLAALAVVVSKDLLGRRAADKATGMIAAELDAVLDSSGEAIIIADLAGRISRFNRTAEKLTGWRGDEAIGNELTDVYRRRDPHSREILPIRSPQELQKAASNAPNACLLIARGGEECPGEESVRSLSDRQGNLCGAVLIFHDASTEHQLQEDLRHARRVEAIGKLAGGISHDFNNLLTSIIGNAELLRMSVEENPELSECAEQIITASSRAADLTGQLLTFSRKGRTEMKPVDIHGLIDEVAKLLGHSLDRRIEVVRKLQCHRHWVRGNAAQLQNAILNLAINARDAMPHGGTLTFATSDITIAEDNSRVCTGEILTGKYIEITVNDTGAGIEQNLREQIFEPFFTTKAEGRGTGLGLAIVYGTIRTHRGSVELKNWPGRGTTFSILLPVCLAPGSGEIVDPPPFEKNLGKGHILVVDDEEAIRLLLAKMLKQLGYRASVCADGMEAVEYYARHGAEVDMVILDLMMPRMDGETAFGRIRTINPAAKILIVSGFSKSGLIDGLLVAGAVGFLPKPFHLQNICEALQKHLS